MPTLHDQFRQSKRIRLTRFQIGLFGAVIAGIAIRWLALSRAGWRFDYDEGMIGLQVRHMLRGEFSVFLPGQPYLGNLESYLLLPLFALFGATPVTLKLVTLCWSGVYVLTVGLVGQSAFGARVGVLAALLAATGPAYLIVVGLKAWGATAETLALGNLTLLITIWMIRKDGWWHWLLLGFVVGLAFWISWLIGFYAIPAAFILLWHFWRDLSRLLRRVLIGIAGFLVGSAPFWIENLCSSFATFRYLIGPDHGDGLTNAGPIFERLLSDSVPRIVSGDPRWQMMSGDGTNLLIILYILGLLALILTRHRRDGGLLGVFALCFIPLYLLSGFGITALNPFGIDATGRYILMLHSVLPIGVALLVRHWRPAVGIVTLVIMANVLQITRIDPVSAFASPYYIHQPATIHPLIEILDSRQIRYVWTDTQIAHGLMFETGERILAADYYEHATQPKALLRFPDVFERVLRADRVAYVELIQPGQRDTPIEQAFAAAKIDYERLTPTPDLLVIVPKSKCDPAQVLAGLGFQY